MKFKQHFFLAAISLVSVMSCKKDESGTTDLRIKLTDNPYNATAVNVDIQKVSINFNADDKGWVDMNTAAGIYNLLDFQNGADTLIAQNVVPANTVKEIRFVLGSQNSIVINGTEYPLTIPSGGESGLKIKVDKKLNVHSDSLIVDFDAALSILQTGTSEFKLSPVLRIK